MQQRTCCGAVHLIKHRERTIVPGVATILCLCLAAKGARVVLTDINLEGAKRVANEIAATGGVASAIAQDVAKPEESEKAVAYAVSTYGMGYQIPAMLDAGAANCAIVNMASIHGTVAAIGNGAYTAAKHAASPGTIGSTG